MSLEADYSDAERDEIAVAVGPDALAGYLESVQHPQPFPHPPADIGFVFVIVQPLAACPFEHVRYVSSAESSGSAAIERGADS